MELYLLAYIEEDIQGRSRLHTILEHLQPDCIVVDHDAWAVSHAEAYEKYLETKGIEHLIELHVKEFPDSNKETLREYLLSLGYAYLVPKTYCYDSTAEKDVDLCFLNPTDDPIWKSPVSLDVREKVGKYLAMSVEELNEEIDEKYLADVEVAPETLVNLANHVTEVARHIETLDRKVVLIGKLPLIFGEYTNVSASLPDIKPIRLKLNEVYDFVEEADSQTVLH